MPAKRTSTSKRNTATKRTELPINEIALEAQRRLGYDPRITRYVTNENELRDIRSDQRHFTAQNPIMINEIEIKGYKLKEIGCLADEDKRVNVRIIHLTKVQPESVAD